MTTLHPAELSNRVAALLRDTAKLHTVAGLGFVSAGSDALVQGLKSDAWQLVDMRSLEGEAAQRALAAAIDAQRPAGSEGGRPPKASAGSPSNLRDAAKPLVFVVDAKGPRAAFVLAQALADRRAGEGGDTVDLGDHVQRALPKDMSAIVVVDGVNDHDSLPRPLQRVDFWEMLGDAQGEQTVQGDRDAH